MKVENINETTIKTSVGDLVVKKQCDDEYPGALIYLGEELYARIEFYEDTKELRLTAYNDESDEPFIAETLKTFN